MDMEAFAFYLIGGMCLLGAAWLVQDVWERIEGWIRRRRDGGV